MSREIKFKFLLEHKESKEKVITRSFTLEELISCYGEETILESHHCDCQPVGETNVVDCNCDDYYSGFKIVGKVQFTGLQDKNGVEIYEGDILKVYKFYFDSSGPLPDILNVKYLYDCFELFRNDIPLMGLRPCSIKDGEVIGNIHTPELLTK